MCSARRDRRRSGTCDQGAETIEENFIRRADFRASVVLGPEKPRRVAFIEALERTPLELRVVASERGQLPAGECPDFHNECRCRRQRSERIGIRHAEDRSRRRVPAVAVLRCRVHDSAHCARRYADVAEGRAGAAKPGDYSSRSFVHRNVVGVPVEAITVERDDDLWLESANSAENVRFKPRAVDPGEHAILVVEQCDIANPENPCGILQLSLPNVAKLCAVFRVAPRTVLAMRETEQRNLNTTVRAPSKQAAACQRLVVRVRKYRQQGRATQVIERHRHVRRCARYRDAL